MSIFIYSHSNNSKGMLELAKKLREDNDINFKGIIRHNNSKFRGGQGKTVINWGARSSRMAEICKTKTSVINNIDFVNLCSNKTEFLYFCKINKINHPEFTTDYSQAQEWANQGKVILSRSNHGSSGNHIYFNDENSENRVVSADFYSVYIPKLFEFRAHIINGKVIDWQQKRLRKTDLNGKKVDPDTINFRVRSFNNGFVFCREDLKLPKVVNELAEQTALVMQKNNYHFGAVDIIYNKNRNTGYVLECNTAPGLEGSTIDSYAQAFKEVLK